MQILTTLVVNPHPQVICGPKGKQSYPMYDLAHTDILGADQSPIVSTECKTGSLGAGFTITIAQFHNVGRDYRVTSDHGPSGLAESLAAGRKEAGAGIPLCPFLIYPSAGAARAARVGGSHRGIWMRLCALFTFLLYCTDRLITNDISDFFVGTKVVMASTSQISA